MNADQRAAAIAAKQYGLLSAGDARRAGLSPTQVKDRLRDRGWRTHSRGLYLLPGAPRRDWYQDAMAGVLKAGPQAWASYLTSCALHQYCRPPVLPHVSVSRRSSSRTTHVALHRSDLAPADRCTVAGIPCTSPSRAIVEAASIVDGPMLAEIVDQALCAERVTVASIMAALRRAGRAWPGADRLRRALEVWAEGIRPGSPAEVRFLRRLREEGARGVVTQHEVFDDDGAFVARVDAAVPERKHAFEYSSDLFHNPRHIDLDEARRERLVALGWRVDEVSKRDLLPSSTRIGELLAATAA
jgi:hypothetical protein